MSAAAPFVLWLDDPIANGHPALGGKFSSLGEMTASGFSVPPGFGITTTAYRSFMDAAGLSEEARRVSAAADKMALEDIKSETKTLIAGVLNAPLPAQLEADIREAYAELERRTGVKDVPVAVRSSGESEDLAGASFAGQYDTFLWVCGIESVLHHVRQCWVGMFGEAVLSYRVDGQAVISRGDFGMCVGIQQMVQARAAGVMFTLNPLNGDRSKVAMEAVWGLGEGVVKGDITPSRFMVDKVTLEIVERKRSDQREEYRFDPSQGVAVLPIEETRIGVSCLEESHVLALAELAKHIERRRGAPQDIEWAVDVNGNVRVLQVRPETVWSRKAAQSIVGKSRSPIGHVLARMAGNQIAKPAATGAKGAA